MKPGLMGIPAAGNTKMELFSNPDHSPDVLLGVVGASYQAGDQVCKAGTPQGEGPPPAPQHTSTSAPGHSVPLPSRILILIWVLPFTPPCLEGQGGMAPWSLQPLHDLWCLWLCLIPGCLLTWGFRVLEGAGWPGGLLCLPPARDNVHVQGAQGNGGSSWGQQGAPFTPLRGPGHIPGMSLCPRGRSPHTWVLRGGVGQEEASSRAVAGAVEQYGHSAGVCHQEWGRRDGVPAVGPCQQGWHRGEELVSLGTRLGTGTPELHLPWLGPCQGQGGFRLLGCAQGGPRVVPHPGWPLPKVVPAPGH